MYLVAVAVAVSFFAENNGHSSMRAARLHSADRVEKVFLGDEQNFLGPLMRLASGDVRDHMISH